MKDGETGSESKVGAALPVEDPKGASPRISAILLVLATGLTWFDLLFATNMLAPAALLAVLVFLALEWRKLGLPPRTMIVIFYAAMLALVIAGYSWQEFASFAAKTMYLPALVIVMTFFRMAVQSSSVLQKAALFSVNQPPGRRYLLAATGSQIFSIVLNIGGFMLLMDMAAATLKSSGRPATVTAIQLRRIANANMRGFAAMIMWSPIGIGLNFLATIANVRWETVVMVGFATASAYTLLGWLFDRWSEPQATNANTAQKVEGGAGALFTLALALAAITLMTWLVQLIFSVSFQAAILTTMISVATLWVVLNRPAGVGLVSALNHWSRQGLAALPNTRSEMGILTAAIFSGLVIAELLPAPFVRDVVEWTGLSGGGLASALLLAIVAAGFMGINPLISATVLVLSLQSADIDMQPLLLVMSALIGWACSTIISPFGTVVAMAGTALNKSALEVGPAQHGWFVLTFIALSCAMFLIFG